MATHVRIPPEGTGQMPGQIKVANLEIFKVDGLLVTVDTKLNLINRNST
jgi:hypothetical protein